MSITKTREFSAYQMSITPKKIIWIDREYVYPNIVAEEVNPDLPESAKESIERRDGK